MADYNAETTTRDLSDDEQDLDTFAADTATCGLKQED